MARLIVSILSACLWTIFSTHIHIILELKNELTVMKIGIFIILQGKSVHGQKYWKLSIVCTPLGNSQCSLGYKSLKVQQSEQPFKLPDQVCICMQ